MLIISFAVLKAVAGNPIGPSSTEFSYGRYVFGENFAYLPSNISCSYENDHECPLPMKCEAPSCVCCKESASATRNETLLCDLRSIHDGISKCAAIENCDDTPRGLAIKADRACLENETCRIERLWNKNDDWKRVKLRCAPKNLIPPNTTTAPLSPETPEPLPWVTIWVSVGISVGIVISVIILIWRLLSLRRRRRRRRWRRRLVENIQANLHPKPVPSLDQNATQLKRLPLSQSALGGLCQQKKSKLQNACRAIRDCNRNGGLRRDWKEIAEDDLKYPRNEILSVDNDKSINPFEVIVFDYLSRRPRNRAVEAVMHLRNSVQTRFEADEEGNCIFPLTEVIREIDPTLNLAMNGQGKIIHIQVAPNASRYCVVVQNGNGVYRTDSVDGSVDGSPRPSRSPSLRSERNPHSSPSSLSSSSSQVWETPV